MFTSNYFYVLAMLKCYIFGFLHSKPLVLFSAFTDLIHHLPMHSDVLNPTVIHVSHIHSPEFPRMLYYAFKDMLYVIFK